MAVTVMAVFVSCLAAVSITLKIIECRDATKITCLFSLNLITKHFTVSLHEYTGEYQQQIQWLGRGGTEKHEIYVAVFGGYLFMTNFYKAGGTRPPWPPPLDPLLSMVKQMSYLYDSKLESRFLLCIVMEEPRNMKSMQLHLAAIKLILQGRGGGTRPLWPPPLDPLQSMVKQMSYLFDSKLGSRFLLCIVMATMPYRIKKHAHGTA